MINQEKYNELKDEMVWIRFCHADPTARAARDREKSRIEYEPILVKLSDAISLIEQPKEWKVYNPELGVESRCFNHKFATPGYPTVDIMQKGIIRELKNMGHEIYKNNQISYDYVYVKPAGEPQIEVTAPLIEVWFGEYKHETKELGLYTGKSYSKEQIDETHLDVVKARENLEKREIVFPEGKVRFSEENFDEIAEAIGVKEGELVWKKLLTQRYTGGEWETEDIGLAEVVRNERNEFELFSPFGFPSFSADQKELKEEIESIEGVILEHHGRSGFSSRNSYTVKPLEKNTEYDVKIVDVMWPAYNSRRYMTERENTQVIDYSQEDVEKAYEIFAKAKKAVKDKRENRFVSKFREKSLDGIFSIVPEGGNEENIEIPEERFLECFRIRTANTQDHRQNRTHTYDVAYIDIDKARQLVRNGKLHINLPEEYMGKMIGAKGSNINMITEKLREQGVEISKIILHPKTKEEINITLENIEKSVREQKSKSYDE